MLLAEEYVLAELASIKEHLHKIVLISGECIKFLLLPDPSDKKNGLCNENVC